MHPRRRHHGGDDEPQRLQLPDRRPEQPYINQSTSTRNDIPHVAQLAISSYSVCVGPLGPPSTGADAIAQYTTTDVKHLNLGFADYGIPRRLKGFPDGMSNTFAVGETAYDNDGSWYGAAQKNCTGLNPMFNAWTITLRHSSNFRSTKNPPNTLPGVGYSGGTAACGTNAAFGSRHAGRPELPHGRWLRPVHQELDQPPHLVGALHPGRRRSHQRR